MVGGVGTALAVLACYSYLKSNRRSATGTGPESEGYADTDIVDERLPGQAASVVIEKSA
jgi:hypothetical protein